VEKLEVRSQSVPFSQRVTGVEDLYQYAGWPVFDIVDAQLAMFGRRGVRLSTKNLHPCLFIDDVQRTHSSLLYGITAGEVERIEIYDGGRMIRVYTKRFLIGMLGREPGPIVYNKTGLMGPYCR
jgi:hypothetical protein